MNNLPQIMSLDPEMIIISDACLFWAGEPDTEFVLSIKEHGQIVPVLITPLSESGILIDGYKRIQALKKLGRNVLAMEAPGSDPYSRALFRLLCHQGRVLDQGKVAAVLRCFHAMGGVTEEIWQILEISPESRARRLWQSWLGLPPAWDSLLAKGHICIECAQLLEKAGAGSISALYPFFAGLGWSRNNCRNLLIWLTEKARMENASLEQIISDLQLGKILCSDLSPGDKIKSILNIVFQARFPALSSMKKELATKLGPICRESGWRVEHRDEFESRELIFSKAISSRKELHKALAGLERLAGTGILDEWPVR